MTTFSGSFSTTDTDKTIRPKKDPVDEVIDILTDSTGGSVQPQRPAPVNVGMMPERRGDVTIPMQQSAYEPFGNIVARDRTMGQTTDFNYQMDPKDNLGFVQSPFTTVKPLPGGEGTRELLQSYDRQGISSLGNIPPQISKASSMPPQNLIDQMNPTGVAGIAQGILGSLTGSSPAIYNLTDEYGDPLGGDNFGLGRKFDNPDTARRLGFIPVGRDAAGNIVYDVDPAVKASQERQERDSRLDDERRERAAMLAAQQQQPVDPCPEGYRLDPVSKVCVPTDDTTQPDNLATRTYDTMTRPEPNYTPATGFTLPAITLPDILG